MLSFTYQDALDIFQVRMLLEPWLIRTYGPQLTKEELEHERELVIKEIVEEIPPKRSRPGISMRHHPHLLLMEKCTNRNINSMLEYSEQQIERIPDARRLAAFHEELSSEEYQKKVLEDHLRLVDLMLAGISRGRPRTWSGMCSMPRMSIWPSGLADRGRRLLKGQKKRVSFKSLYDFWGHPFSIP